MKRSIWLLFSVLVIAGCSDKKEIIEEKPVKEEPERVIQVFPEEPKYFTELTGLPYDGEKVFNNYGVMIENSPAARPQSGLVFADLVFEMEVEAQITRFFAIFHNETPSIVGPVRSARHYFIPIAQSLNAAYIHYGGSPQAYSLLKQSGYTSIDGITQGTYFTRDQSRKAPHNAYLYPDRLPRFELEIKNDYFDHAEITYQEQKDVKEIRIDYNKFTRVMYQYDENTNTYIRYLEGEKHLDRETEREIAPANVVVLFANHSSLGDGSGRIDIDFISGGEARYYTKGKEVLGTWVNQNGQIVFLNEQGEKLSLNPGKTWVQVVRSGKEIVTN